MTLYELDQDTMYVTQNPAVVFQRPNLCKAQK